MRRCTKCEIEKDDSQFRGTKTKQCIQCEIEKAVNKMIEYKSINIGLENLDTTLENIILRSKYLISKKLISLDEAISLVNEGKAQVYKSDTIYMPNHEDESWIVRYNVNERDNYKCHYCGVKGDTVDHLIPKSKGGEFNEDNLVCCCGDCNIEKDNMSYEEYKSNLLLLRTEKYLKIQQKTKKQIEAKNILKKKQTNKIPNVLLKQKDKYEWD